jgi:hypothetical protein
VDRENNRPLEDRKATFCCTWADPKMRSAALGHESPVVSLRCVTEARDVIFQIFLVWSSPNSAFAMDVRLDADSNLVRREGKGLL